MAKVYTELGQHYPPITNTGYTTDGAFMSSDPNYALPVTAETLQLSRTEPESANTTSGNTAMDGVNYDATVTSQSSNRDSGYVKLKPGPAKGSRKGDLKSKDSKWPCDVCGRVYNYSHLLRRHQRIHDGSKPYVCAICGKDFRLYDTWRRHLLVHTGEKPLACSQCNRRFRDSSNLKQHMETHRTSNNFICNTCGRAYKNARLLKNHSCRPVFTLPAKMPLTEKGNNTEGENTASEEPIEPKRVSGVPCVKCSKIFSNFPELKEHIMQEHNSEEIPVENSQNVKSGRPVGSRSKSRSSREKSTPHFKCIFCHKTVQSKHGLKLHMLRIHNKEYDNLEDKDQENCVIDTANNPQDIYSELNATNTEPVVTDAPKVTESTGRSLPINVPNNNPFSNVSSLLAAPVPSQVELIQGLHQAILQNPLLVKELFLRQMLNNSNFLQDVSKMLNNNLTNVGIKRPGEESTASLECPTKKLRMDVQETAVQEQVPKYYTTNSTQAAVLPVIQQHSPLANIMNEGGSQFHEQGPSVVTSYQSVQPSYDYIQTTKSPADVIQQHNPQGSDTHCAQNLSPYLETGHSQNVAIVAPYQSEQKVDSGTLQTLMPVEHFEQYSAHENLNSENVPQNLSHYSIQNEAIGAAQSVQSETNVYDLSGKAMAIVSPTQQHDNPENLVKEDELNLSHYSDQHQSVAVVTPYQPEQQLYEATAATQAVVASVSKQAIHPPIEQPEYSSYVLPGLESFHSAFNHIASRKNSTSPDTVLQSESCNSSSLGENLTKFKFEDVQDVQTAGVQEINTNIPSPGIKQATPQKAEGNFVPSFRNFQKANSDVKVQSNIKTETNIRVDTYEMTGNKEKNQCYFSHFKISNSKA